MSLPIPQPDSEGAKVTPELQAFSNFSELSERLTSAYGLLEQQVAQLNDELAAARAERQQERHQRERLANRLETLLETLPAAVVLVDKRDRIDRFNLAAEQLFSGLAWGRRWQEVRCETLQTELSTGDWLLQGERQVTVSRQPLGDGGQILVIIDVTQQRELEQRLQRQNRLSEMGEMAAQLAHQVRTPLAAALLYAGQLGKSGLNERQREKFTAQLIAGLRHTERLIADMLAFSHGGNFQAHQVRLGELIQRAIDTLQPRLAAGAHPIHLQLDEPEDQLLGNAEALTGVLCNLLDNSISLGGAGTQVWISLYCDTEQLCVRIEDDGPGIPSDIHSRLFDPFFTTRERGTGLGLAVAQAVLLAHGGSIRIVEPKHAGAAFELRLPRLLNSQGAKA